MLFGGIAGLVHGDRLIPLALVLGGVYWLFLILMERRWWIRRQFAKRPDVDTEQEWRFTEDQITTRSDLATGEVQWRAFTKVVRAPTGLLLYSNDSLLYWLPRNGFASDSDFERVAEIGASKVPKSYSVT